MVKPQVGQFAHEDQTWVALSAGELPIADAYAWAVRDDCGAVVLFSGTIRDHADGRHGVSMLTYEAYEEQAVPKILEIAVEVRRRWPTVGRMVLLHRTGQMGLGESSVIVVVSSPHRPEAFEAARYSIDALKASVPIWKHEVWETGSDWGTGAQSVVQARSVATAHQRSEELREGQQ